MGSASDKQIKYCAVLSSQLGIGDEWDLVGKANGWSRSKAQRKADFASVSTAISYGIEQLEVEKRRADLPEGSIEGEGFKLGGKWIKLKAETLDLYRSNSAKIDLTILNDRWLALKALNTQNPLMTAIMEQVDGVVLTPKEKALDEIRRLMLLNGISKEEI